METAFKETNKDKKCRQKNIEEKMIALKNSTKRNLRPWTAVFT
jgi:hypothetical protein